MGNGCESEKRLSWVAGNDVLLLARVYEKVLDAGEVTDLPFDLSACDDIEVSLSTDISNVTLPREAWEIKEDEDNCIAMLIPHELTQGTWAVEITCKRNGYHVRSFEFTFKVVETNCEAQTTFEVVDGCQSASVRVALQIVPQAFVRGQNSYEAWKELPGNEGKSLQEYIDTVLDMAGVMARLAEAEEERVQAEEARAEAEQQRAGSEVERATAEGGRAEAETNRGNAERLRAANETNRQENEAGRREAERSRAESEARRAAAESAREQAEQNRETAEQNREQATATALQTVTAATSAANDAAAAATEATESAEKVNARLSTDGGAVVLTVIDRRGVANTKEVGFRIAKTYETVAAMNADAANVEEGRFVMIAGDVEQTDTGKLYVKGSTGFTFLTDLSGARGIKGDPFTYADFTPEQIAELQRPATEAAALAEQKATEAGRVNATLNGTELTVTDRNGNSVTQDVQGPKGEPGDKGDPGTTDYNELENKPDLSKKQDALTADGIIRINKEAGTDGRTFILILGNRGSLITSVVESTDVGGWERAGNQGIPTVELVRAKLGAEKSRAEAAEKQNADDIDDIEAIIPAQASAQNQLADKNFVNSSISTNTANFVGTYNSLAELQAVQNPTNNDYGFVIEQDAAGNEYYDRYKYVASSQQWLFEYKVESTPFTAAQWAAIQSGITSALVTKLSALPTNAELQQALTLINTTLAGKQDVLQFYRETNDTSVNSGEIYINSSNTDVSVDLTAISEATTGIADVNIVTKGDSANIYLATYGKTASLIAFSTHTNNRESAGITIDGNNGSVSIDTALDGGNGIATYNGNEIETVTQIVAPANSTDATLPVTSLACEASKYYRLDVPVETMAVTLPSMSGVTTVKTVVLYLTAGTTPAVTISAADGKEVLYQDGFEIESGKTYEVNALFNGAAWVVASVEIIVE